eukprot:2814269-Amphidinium_carterae.1
MPVRARIFETGQWAVIRKGKPSKIRKRDHSNTKPWSLFTALLNTYIGALFHSVGPFTGVVLTFLITNIGTKAMR